ncbi:hypothetical protein [Candidatus Chloroploca asiatica]|nr:hypothetical protein [Candidatus Chloroploca asiatica]
MTYLSKFLLLSIILLLLAGCSRPNGNSTDTAQIVGETAVLIADFSPPSGYEPEFGLHAIGYTVVAYNSGDNGGHLYLVQAGEGTDDTMMTTLEETLANLVPGYRADDSRMTVVEQRPFSIRDQPVTLILSEGAKWDNERVRQVTAVFQGKEGPTLLTLLEPVSQWDEAAVESFLSSIR